MRGFVEELWRGDKPIGYSALVVIAHIVWHVANDQNQRNSNFEFQINFLPYNLMWIFFK